MQSDFFGNFSLIGTQSQFISHLVIMNSKFNISLLKALVNNSQKVILADGGANQYYYHIKDHSKIDCIVGDFDSVNQEVLSYYKNLGIKTCHLDDQDHTDCQKAISTINQDTKGVVCVVGGAGTRLDHNFSTFSTITKFGRKLKNSEIFLINNNGIMFYLKPQKQYTIKVSKYQLKSACGVITFGKVKQISTQGLKWDMGKDKFVGSLEMGDMLSTSNQITGEEVKIKVSDEAFWVTHIVLSG